MAFQLQRVQKLLGTEPHTYEWPTIVLTDNTLCEDWRFASLDKRVRSQYILDVITRGNGPEQRIQDVEQEKQLLQETIRSLRRDITSERRKSHDMAMEIENVKQKKLEAFLEDSESDNDVKKEKVDPATSGILKRTKLNKDEEKKKRPVSAPPLTFVIDDEDGYKIGSVGSVSGATKGIDEYPPSMDNFLCMKEEQSQLNDTINNLKNEMIEREERTMQLETELNKLKEELNKKNESEIETQKQAIIMEESMRTLQENIAKAEEMKIQYGDTNSEIANLKEQLSKKEAEVADAFYYASQLKEEIDELKTTLSIKSQELNSERQSKASLQIEKEEMEKLLAKHEEQITEERRMSEQLEEELNIMRKNSSLQNQDVTSISEILHETGSIQSKMQAVVQLENLLHECEKEKEKLQELLERSHEENVAIRCQFSDLQAEMRTSVQDLESKKEELEELRERCSEVPALREELTSLHSQIHSLSNDPTVTSLQEELLAMQEQLLESQEKDQEIENLRTTIENYKTLGGCDHTDCVKRENELRQLKKCVERQLIPLIEELEKIRSRTERGDQKLEEELTGIREKLKDFHDANSGKEKCTDRCNNETCLRQFAHLEEITKYLQQVREELGSEIERLQKENKDLLDRLNDCEQSHQTKDGICETLQNNIEKLTEELKSKEEEIEKLQSEMENIKKDDCQNCITLEETIDNLKTHIHLSFVEKSESVSLYGTASDADSEEEQFVDCEVPSKAGGDSSNLPEITVAHASLPAFPKFILDKFNNPISIDDILDDLKIKLEQCQSEKNLIQQQKQLEVDNWKQRHANLKHELEIIKSDETANQRKYGGKVQELQKVVQKYQVMKHKYEDLLLEEEKRRVTAEQQLMEKYNMKKKCVCQQLGLVQPDDTPLDLVQLLVCIIHSGIKLLSVKKIIHLQEEAKKRNKFINLP